MSAEKNPEIRSARTPCPEEATYLELVRTAEALTRPLVEILKTADLSATQYNVLRILRGASDGLTCGQIGERMITRDPDITRLLDRMEHRGLITRGRDAKDRRVVLTRITLEGLSLVGRLDQPVRDMHRNQLEHLGLDRLRALRELLAASRTPGA